MPPRLPLAVDPLSDEPWPNYVERLSAELAVDTRTLRVHLGMPPSRYGEMSYREQGIAMTPATAVLAAEATRLDIHTVRRMQLQRFNHTLLRMDDDFVASVDPLARPGRSNAGGLRLQQAGSAHFHASTHACPSCLSENPCGWRIQWRLRWHVMCPEHGFLIEKVGLPPTPPGDPDRLLKAQQRIMRLASGTADPSGRSSWSIVNDTAAAVEIELYPRTPPSRRGENVPTPQQLGELLPDALRFVTRSLQTNSKLAPGLRTNRAWASNAAAVIARRRLDDDSLVRAAVKNAIDAPAKRRSRPAFKYVPTGPRRSFSKRAQSDYAALVPQVMPERLYFGQLSDLLYPMSLLSGRNIASIAVIVAGVEVSPSQAVALLDLPPNSAKRLTKAFAAAQERGVDGALWDAVRVAGSRLEDESTDYGHRRRVARDPGALQKIRRCSPFSASPEQHLRRWLLEWWALDFMRSARLGELTATQGDAAALEASHGPELRSILETEAAAMAS